MPILIQLLLGVIVAGFCVWLFNLLVPLEGKWKVAVNGLLGLILFLWILYCVSVFFGWGWFDGAGHVAPPKGR